MRTSSSPWPTTAPSSPAGKRSRAARRSRRRWKRRSRRSPAERPSTLASGRTDAGVHALGQVVSFRTESRLPAEVLAAGVERRIAREAWRCSTRPRCHDGFHATHDALRKRYRYVIHNGPVRDVFARRYAWHYAHGRLDAEAMQRAAAALLGTHDFSSFETTGAPRKTSVRTVYDLCIERGRGERRALRDPGNRGQRIPL